MSIGWNLNGKHQKLQRLCQNAFDLVIVRNTRAIVQSSDVYKTTTV